MINADVIITSFIWKIKHNCKWSDRPMSMQHLLGVMWYMSACVLCRVWLFVTPRPAAYQALCPCGIQYVQKVLWHTQIVLVCSECHSKISLTGWLKQQDFIFSLFWRWASPRSRCQHHQVLVKFLSLCRGWLLAMSSRGLSHWLWGEGDSAREGEGGRKGRRERRRGQNFGRAQFSP